LKKYPQVNNAAVIVYQEVESCLVGYVMLKEGSPSITPSDLASYLREKLPLYMVPKYIIFMKVKSCP
jgi:hypothetical protein